MSQAAAIGRRSLLEKAANATPWLILAYCSLHFLLRVAQSPYLETDEAQFVGQTGFALGYFNSHPPLYNWLVAAALQLTGDNWAAAVALVKHVLIGATYWLAFDAMRRITGSAVAGLLTAASFLFLPQIVWKAQITLAHSVLVMFAVVAVLHAVAVIVQRQTLWGFVWLGAAASAGLMAKYNFVLSLAAILAAAMSVGEIRRALLRPALALSAAVAIFAVTPHLVWLADHFAEATARLAKLERGNRLFGGLDLPHLGIDGLLAAGLGAIAWAGPLLAVWLVLYHFSAPVSALPAARLRAPLAQAFERFFGRAAVTGFAAFALILLAGDFHYVHERYLTAVLMPLPFWLALAYPLDARRLAPQRFAMAGAAMAGLMLAGLPLLHTFGREQLAYPYRAIAASIQNSVHAPFALYASEQKYAANIALLIEGATLWPHDRGAKKVVVLWTGKGSTPGQKSLEALGAGFEAEGAPFITRALYENRSGAFAQMQAQVYVRRGAAKK